MIEPTVTLLVSLTVYASIFGTLLAYLEAFWGNGQ